MIQQVQNALGQALTMVVTFVPKFLAFLVVLFIGWLVALGIQKAMDAVLERVGFDRLVERGGVKRALARSRYDASSLLSRTVFYIVMLFVLQLSFGVWGPNPVSNMLDRVVAYLPNVLAALVIVVVGAAIAAGLRDVVSAAAGGLSFGKALATAGAIAVLVVTVFAALDQLNIAPLIVTGLFYAILVAVVGILVVSLGGAGIQPLREYWGRFLNAAERSAPQMSAAMSNVPQAAQQRMQERGSQVQQMRQGGQGGPGGQQQRQQQTQRGQERQGQQQPAGVGSGRGQGPAPGNPGSGY